MQLQHAALHLSWVEGSQLKAEGQGGAGVRACRAAHDVGLRSGCITRAVQCEMQIGGVFGSPMKVFSQVVGFIVVFFSLSTRGSNAKADFCPSNALRRILDH